MANPHRVIIDVDPGVDDALALLMATASRELEILGVTVVSGNVPLDTGTRNALDALFFAGAGDVRVFRGADRPLVREPVHTREVHGERGLGSAELLRSDAPAEENAVGFLVDRIAPDVSVIAVGPLTNLAKAERECPGLLARAREIVVMGGAIRAPGNSSPGAEYNFFADPHAAREVVAANANLTLVPLDVTYQVGVPAGAIASLEESERVRFFEQASRVVVSHGKATGGFEGIHLHDPVAVGLALAPELFSTEEFWIDVETTGELTSGQVVVDERRVDEAKRRGVLVRCLTGARVSDFLTLFSNLALGTSWPQGEARSSR